MGQSIVVTEKPSSYPGVVRFETNRALTGMGHERYRRDTEVWGERPPDELARRLFTKPSVAGVQINSNVVTVDLEKGYTSEGLLEVIENLYRFYPDAPEGAGAEAPTEPAADSDATTSDADALAGAAPEMMADPADATAETTDDAPAPQTTEPEATAANPAAEAEADPLPEPDFDAKPQPSAEPEAAEPEAAGDPEATAEPEAAPAEATAPETDVPAQAEADELESDPVADPDPVTGSAPADEPRS